MKLGDMTHKRERLFFDKTAFDTFQAFQSGATEEIERLNRDHFLATPDKELVEHFVSKYGFEPLVLHEDGAEMTQSETRVEVTGWPGRINAYDDERLFLPETEVNISIPFSGSPILWLTRPGTTQGTFPTGTIEPNGPSNSTGTLNISFRQPHDVPSESFRSDYEDTLMTIRYYIGYINKDVQEHNESLPGIVQAAVHARRARIEKHDGISRMLNIPLKTKDGAPSMQPIRLERRITVSVI
jgi:hypothetical protein